MSYAIIAHTFASIIVMHFQNINLERNSKLVSDTTDLKNELRIITLLDNIFKLLEEFFEVQSKGGLINSDTLQPFNKKQVFNKLWTKKSPQIKSGRPADTVNIMRM